jgi:hypothetical protein
MPVDGRWFRETIVNDDTESFTFTNSELGTGKLTIVSKGTHPM